MQKRKLFYTKTIIFEKKILETRLKKGGKLILINEMIKECERER